MSNKWKIIHDCDGDNGEPTCWSREINSKTHGKYVWIERTDDSEFEITSDRGHLKTCKSLTSAKRWVAMNIA